MSDTTIEIERYENTKSGQERFLEVKFESSIETATLTISMSVDKDTDTFLRNLYKECYNNVCNESNTWP